jgi:hypothetical protein
MPDLEETYFQGLRLIRAREEGPEIEVIEGI